MSTNTQVLLRNEWQQVIRDPMLIWLGFMPLLFALGMRYGLPALTDWTMAKWQYDFIGENNVLALSLLPQTAPMLIGMVTGFLLLDQKDDRTLSALMVTPLQLDGYLKVKLAIPGLFTVLINLVCIPAAGLVDLTPAQLLLASVAPAPLAVIMSLFLAGFAQNKVQGFALTKITGAVLFPPVLAWFFVSDWNWLYGLLPTYWTMKAFWLSMDSLGQAIVCVAAGWLYHLLLIRLLWGKLTRQSLS